MTAHDGFLARWSRLKRDGGGAPPAAPATTPPAPLPELDTLNFEADFTGFLRQEVEEAVRRVALKKLFHSGPFNVMDGLDTYIDDYSIPDPIDEATLRSLVQARGLLFDADPAQDGDAAETAALPAAATPAVLPKLPADMSTVTSNPDVIEADPAANAGPNPGEIHVLA